MIDKKLRQRVDKVSTMFIRLMDELQHNQDPYYLKIAEKVRPFVE